MGGLRQQFELTLPSMPSRAGRGLLVPVPGEPTGRVFAHHRAWPAPAVKVVSMPRARRSGKRLQVNRGLSHDGETD